MKRRQRSDDTVEMQMGPMIDMVFLLLVFFMVTAKPIEPESDIKMTLPGAMAQETPLELPDEQRLVIQNSGQVLLNELALDEPGSKDLPSLERTLVRFSKSCQANGSKALITLHPEDEVPHQRIVDVLNICAVAKIRGVTFASDGGNP